jgi:hypothetical protein
MSKSKEWHAANDLIMKAIIFYDDFEFVARAKAALQRIGCRPDISARWIIKSWPVPSSNQAALAEKTLADGANAHLIVIPAQRVHPLPFWLHDWLERWAPVRQIKDAAVAVTGDGMNEGLTTTVSAELTLLVRKHGLNLIIDQSALDKAAAKDPVELFARLLRERQQPPAVERSPSADAAAPESFRGLGINE